MIFHFAKLKKIRERKFAELGGCGETIIDTRPQNKQKNYSI